jgi:ABC-type multidrug transport system ATPase subunit
VAKLKHKNIGILVTDHNVHETLSIVDRAYLLFEGKILKAEGTMAGVSDLFLMYGNDKYNGLFIEMKTEKGRQSDSQKNFEKKCANFKYKYIICRSFEEFRTEITNYINNKDI